MKVLVFIVLTFCLISCQSGRLTIEDSRKYVSIITDSAIIYCNLKIVNEYAKECPDELGPDNEEYPFDNHVSAVFYADHQYLHPLNCNSMERFNMLAYYLYGIMKMLHNHEAIVVDKHTKIPLEYSCSRYIFSTSQEGHERALVYDSKGNVLLSTLYMSSFDHIFNNDSYQEIDVTPR